VNVHRNSAAVILYGHGIVAVDRYLNPGAETCLGLVDRIVDQLEDHVVEPRPIVGVSDVHPRPFSDRLETFENLDVIGGIGRWVCSRQDEASASRQSIGAATTTPSKALTRLYRIQSRPEAQGVVLALDTP
jgi:hypothetical protein